MKLRYSPKFGLMLETHPEGLINPVLEILPVLRTEPGLFIYQIPGTDIELAVDHYHNFDFPRGVSD